MITLASEAGRRGLPYEAVYCASKFGQVGFTRALDHELREHGIRCTNVCPGGVATDFALEEGRGRTEDVLPGMMTAEDVAEVVVFVLERPRRLRILETAFRPMTESELGMSDGNAVKWGIISTAHINRLRDPGRARVAEGRARRRSRAATAARAEAYAREWEIPRAYGSYEELLADPEIEAVYISLPNTLHCEWSIRARRGREARALREADVAPSRGGRGGVRRGRARRAAPVGGVHVPPQPADGDASRALVADGAIGELRLVRSTFSYSLYDADNIRLRTDLEGGALMDVGCYCVSGSRLLAGEPESVYGAAWVGRRRGTDWVFAATMRFPGDVLAQFDCGTALPEPRRARGDRERGLALPRRPVALRGRR